MTNKEKELIKESKQYYETILERIEEIDMLKGMIGEMCNKSPSAYVRLTAGDKKLEITYDAEKSEKLLSFAVGMLKADIVASHENLGGILREIEQRL